MINLDKLKSLFIVPKEEAAKTTETPSTNETADNNPPEKSGKVPAAPPTAPQPAYVQKFYDALMEAIKAHNIEGFDYLEFKNSLKALESLPLDEPTKFKSAFATASTMGLTQEKLLSSAQYYLSILDAEKNKFRGELEKHVNEQLHARENEVKNMEAIIAQKTTQIQTLTNEITEHQKALNDMKIQMDDVASKIGKNRDDFLQTLTYLQGQLNGDIELIKKFLA